MSVAIPIPLLQNLPDVAVSLGVGVDEYALCWDNDTAKFVLRVPASFDGTPYALLAGRAGGQTLYGGTAANDDITIHGTSDATRTTSYVLLQPSGGNVGIGTVVPGALCEIYKTQNTLTSLIVNNPNAGDYAAAALQLTSSGGTGLIRAFGGSYTAGGVYAHWQDSLVMDSQELAGGVYLLASDANGILRFGTGGSAVGYERMRITSAGNVGINDTAPAEKLDVTGNINATGVYKVDDVQVLSNRVIDARCADVANSGDATTDGLIDALRDAMVAHGLVAAA